MSKRIIKWLGVIIVAVALSSTMNVANAPLTPVTAITSGGGHTSTGGHVSTSARSGGVHTSSPASRGFTSSRSAMSPASRFGSVPSRSTTTMSPASRFGATRSSASNQISSSSRSYTSSFTKSPAMRSQVVNARESSVLNTTRSMLKGSSYTQYFSNPYNHRYFGRTGYNNYWYYSWMWNRQLTDKQHNILVAQGIDHDELLKNVNKTLRVTIDDNGTEKSVIVTRSQYKHIKVGDKVHVFDGRLTVNGETLK